MKKTPSFLIFALAFVLGLVVPAQAYRDLETGEFITKDPAGFVDGPNQYTYVRQNPWTHFDPEGLYEDLGGGIHVTTDKDGHHTILTGGNRELGSNAMVNHMERAVGEVVVNNADAKSLQRLDRAVNARNAAMLPLAVAAVTDPNATDRYLGIVGATTGELMDRGGGFSAVPSRTIGKTASTEKAESVTTTQLALNKQQGQAYENQVQLQLQTTQMDVTPQITLRTQSGIKTRMDFVSRDPVSNEVSLTEAKSSFTAPLTFNQRAAFPEIEQSGAVVVGKGKPPFSGGTKIPPTKVEVVRPPEKEKTDK